MDNVELQPYAGQINRSRIKYVLNFFLAIFLSPDFYIIDFIQFYFTIETQKYHLRIQHTYKYQNDHWNLQNPFQTQTPHHITHSNPLRRDV